MPRSNGRSPAKKGHRSYTKLLFPGRYKTPGRGSKASKDEAEAKRLLRDLRRMSSDLGVIVLTAKSIALKLEEINNTSASFWKEYPTHRLEGNFEGAAERIRLEVVMNSSKRRSAANPNGSPGAYRPTRKIGPSRPRSPYL